MSQLLVTKNIQNILSENLTEQLLITTFNDVEDVKIQKHEVIKEDMPKNLIELDNEEAVFQKLSQLDWSFSDENTSYLTHDIHPYPAKFIPQIPHNLIKNLSLFGEIIYDPFGGSGTTALEAILLRRMCICSDANPLSKIIGEVKTTELRRDANTYWKCKDRCQP